MGGNNQQTLNPPASPSNSSKVATPIRIHEKSGEVHLHDDVKGKKFACSVADFYSAWDQAKKSNFSAPLELLGHDGNQKPMVAKFEKVVLGNSIDVAITIEAAQLGATISQIDKFVSGQS